MWAQIITSILGLWLMAAPGIFGFGKTASDDGHIIGPVIVTFAVVAWWECTRNVRLFNLPLGAWLVLAPWILAYDNDIATINDMATGILVLVFSLVKGKIEGKYGGGWRSLWQTGKLHEKEAAKEN